jgi:class 3 adenylate cyclase
MNEVAPVKRADQSALEAVGRVLSAIGGGLALQPVLDLISAEAAGLCGAEVAFTFLREGDAFRFAAASGGTPEHWAWEKAHPNAVDRGSIVGRVALMNGPVQIEDVPADPEYVSGAYSVGSIRTLLGVPIRTDEGLIGAFGLGRARRKVFTDAEIELVTVFADQAAIAIRLARLLTQTSEALERESAVGQVLQTISRSTFELETVLQTVIDSAVRLSRASDGNILRDEGGTFRMAAYTAGVPESFREVLNARPFVPERGTLLGRTLMELGPVQVADYLADPEYTMVETARLVGFRTMLGIPLLHDGVAIGALAVWRLEVNPFSPAEIALLQTFADQAAIAISNVKLFETVERQRTELARFAPEVAGMLSTEEGQALLAGHRREISALFCDLRGFTAFTETAEPEELFTVLRQYHAAVGDIVVAHGGTVEHFAGDGLMVFFNDPTPLPDHQMAAVRSACAMRDRFAELSAGWRKRGYELGLGIGIAVGYATLGRIGFEGRHDYAAIGPVVNLASRLSDVAGAGEILINQRLHAMVEDRVEAEPVSGLELKGFSHAVAAYRVVSVRE